MRLSPWMMLFALACSPASIPDADTPAGLDPSVDNPVEDPADPPGLPGATGSVSTFATGSMAATPDGDVWVTDADNGELLLGPATTSHWQRLAVGAEPTRLAIAEGRVYATLRGAGEVVMVDTTGNQPVVAGRAEVGAEPYDLIASNGVLYVSLSQEGAVVALDADTLAPLGRYEVGGEPRWLTLADGVLLVAHVDRPELTAIDLATGALEAVALPTVQRFTDRRCVPRALDVRISGAPAFDAASGELFVPAVYVDTQLAEFPENLPSNDRGVFEACGELDAVSANLPPPGEIPPYYAPPVPPESAGKVGRFNAAVVGIHLANHTTRVLAVSTRDPVANRAIRGVPGDVSLRGSGPDLQALVPLPSAGMVVHLAVNGARTTEVVGGFETRHRGLIEATVGVSSATWGSNKIVAWSPVARQLHRFPVPSQPNALDNAEGLQQPAPASSLPASVLAGRELFFTSQDTAVVAAGSGASCAACHVDGRTDGFTWKFEDMPRQTPTLAGDITATTPLTWLGEVDTVMEEIDLTTTLRMGGTGLEVRHARELAAFVDNTRDLLRPTVTDDLADTVALGREIFERADVGCATCHVGASGTDGEVHAVFGFDEPTNTPSLKGVGGTGPYLHDGSALTMRDVLIRARDGSMGDTSSLSEAELVALETYLRHW